MAPASPPAIRLSRVNRSFGARRALRDVSLEVPCGQRVALLGPNGSGKSTLIRILAGLLKADSGAVELAGMPARGTATRALTGVVAHQTLLYDHLTIEENLRLFGRLYGLQELDTRINELLGAFRLCSRRDDPVRTLSRGLQQRTALARALLHRPGLLLLDEPDTGLDLDALRELEQLLTGPVCKDVTVIMATHDVDLARRTADRALVLCEGVLATDVSAGRLDGATLRELYEAGPRTGTRPHVFADVLGGRLGSGDPTRGAIPPSTTSANLERPRAPDGGHARPATRRRTAARYLSAVMALLQKDLLEEWRTREAITGTAVFALLTLVVFHLALTPDPSAIAGWGAGVLWSSLVFASVLGFGRAFAAERERGTLDGLLLAPVDRSALYAAKLAACFCLVLALAAITLPIAGVLFNLPVLRLPVLTTVVAGSAALATVGTLFSAVTANLRAREFLLPVLLLPVALPVVIAAASATADALERTARESPFPWLGLLAAFGAIVFALSLVLFEYVVEE